MSVVEKKSEQANGRKKRSCDILWAKIGKCALENGNTAMSKKFTHEF